MSLRTITAALSRTTLSTRILAGLGLGAFLGLFVGEAAAALQPIADIYIRLMQMTVLPYLVLGLIIGFGQLRADEARRLALRAGMLLVLVWILSCFVVAAMPLAFPDRQTASFFSNALVEPKQFFSIAEIYFSANPFHSLANAVVPAVVLFSAMIGIGLMGLDDKDRFLDALRVLNEAIVRVTRFNVSLTPIGVFAIVAVVAGTMTPETVERLEVYFVAFAAASTLLAFLVLPLLVTALTPFRYLEIVGAARTALLTAFVANNAFIVLPILVEQSKVLLEKHGYRNEESDSVTEVLVPILFNFPNAGKLLTLLFVPFAAWLAGNTLSLADYARLFAVGVPSYFAKAQVALPFLMDIFGLPHDLYQLYVPTTILSGKFDSMVTAMNLLAFALIGASAMGGFLVLRRRRLLQAVAAMLVGMFVTVLGVRVLLAFTVDTTYRMDEALKNMHASRNTPAAIVHRDRSTVRRNDGPGDAVTLERIRQRGVLRIGYDPNNLPFSFVNAGGELVGFDIELAHSLAAALGAKPEFVPVRWAELPQDLAEGVIDLMPSVWYRPFWFASLRLSAPYVVGTMGLAVRDERRDEFASVSALWQSRGLKVGVPLDIDQLRPSMERYFGGSDVEFVTVESWAPFFEGQHPELDAFLVPVENGAAWTLLHPEYTVVVPQPDPVTIPSAFGVAHNAADLVAVVNEWVVFATNAGIVRRAYDYWILGQGTKVRRPRWSIARDVLGWME